MQENGCEQFCSTERDRESAWRHSELTKHKFLCQNKLTLLLMKPKAGGASQSTYDASNFKELYSKDNSISVVPSLYFSLSLGKSGGTLLLEKETLKQFPLLGCERCTLYFTQKTDNLLCWSGLSQHFLRLWSCLLICIRYRVGVYEKCR